MDIHFSTECRCFRQEHVLPCSQQNPKVLQHFQWHKVQKTIGVRETWTDICGENAVKDRCSLRQCLSEWKQFWAKKSIRCINASTNIKANRINIRIDIDRHRYTHPIYTIGIIWLHSFEMSSNKTERIAGQTEMLDHGTSRFLFLSRPPTLCKSPLFPWFSVVSMLLALSKAWDEERKCQYEQ